FFSSRRRHTRSKRDWSSDVCSSDLSLLVDLKLLLRLRQIHLIRNHPPFRNHFVHLGLDYSYFGTRPQPTIRAQQSSNILPGKTTSYEIYGSIYFLKHCCFTLS